MFFQTYVLKLTRRNWRFFHAVGGCPQGARDKKHFEFVYELRACYRRNASAICEKDLISYVMSFTKLLVNNAKRPKFKNGEFVFLKNYASH